MPEPKNEPKQPPRKPQQEPTKKPAGLPRWQSETETEARPYLDTEGGE
jgi:hypothetical protein